MIDFCCCIFVEEGMSLGYFRGKQSNWNVTKSNNCPKALTWKLRYISNSDSDYTDIVIFWPLALA